MHSKRFSVGDIARARLQLQLNLTTRWHTTVMQTASASELITYFQRNLHKMFVCRLSANCNATLNATYPTVCTCILQPETPTKSFDKEVDEYVKCVGGSANDTSNQFVVQAATQQLVGYYCEEDPKDPCTQSTLNDDTNQYKPINLPI